MERIAQCGWWNRRPRPTVWLATRIFAVAGMMALAAGQTLAAEPLHVRVDRLVEAKRLVAAAPKANDADFLRRVSLDLIGVIPTSTEARAFLDDATPDKRVKLIERYLASPDHARHLSTKLDVMLMERRPDKVIAGDKWRQYLYDSVLANKPYDKLAREILSADGADPSLRPAAKFVIDRDAEPATVTRDIGRVFFGRDMQCCQCHDHPLVDDYYQAEYYGIYSLISRTYVFVGAKEDKNPYLAEKAEGDPTFVSVFDKSRQQKTGRPRVPAGPAVEEPQFPKGEEYAVKPADNVRPVPKYSRRAKLAEIGTTNNVAFQRNIVNRVWAMMFGRGLVEPVDMHHRGNPPVDAELLDLLASEFAAQGYNLRWLIGELAQSETYQRSIDVPANLAASLPPLVARLPEEERVQAERATAAAKEKEAVGKLEAELTAARGALFEANTNLTKAQTAIPELKKAADAATAALKPVEQDLATKTDAAGTLLDAANKAAEAAKKLVGNKDVADAAAKLKAQHDQFAAAVAAAQKLLAERQAAMKASADAMAAAQKLVEAATARSTEAGARVDQVYAQFVQVRTKWLELDSAADLVRQRIADAKLLVKVTETDAALVASNTEMAKAAADLAAVRQAVAAKTNEMSRLATAATEAEKAATAAANAASQAQREQANRQTTAQAVADAFAKTEQALKLLPGDVELTAAAAKLKARADQAATEVAAQAPRLVELIAAGKAAGDQLTVARAAQTNMANEIATMSSRVAEQENALKQATDKHAAMETERADLEKKATDRLARRLTLGSVRALSPEQIAWSMMQAAGVVAPQRSAAAAEWEKAHPAATPAAASEPQRAIELAKAVEQTAYTKLLGNVGPFIPLFAAAAGQPQDDFYATADQALFFANGGHVRGWLAPGGENLTARLGKLTDARALADELYLSVLTRRPSGDEIADVEKYLAARPNDRAVALQDLVWGLLSSAEFRFNH